MKTVAWRDSTILVRQIHELPAQQQGSCWISLAEALWQWKGRHCRPWGKDRPQWGNIGDFFFQRSNAPSSYPNIHHVAVLRVFFFFLSNMIRNMFMGFLVNQPRFHLFFFSISKRAVAFLLSTFLLHSPPRNALGFSATKKAQTKSIKEPNITRSLQQPHWRWFSRQAAFSGFSVFLVFWCSCSLVFWVWEGGLSGWKPPVLWLLVVFNFFWSFFNGCLMVVCGFNDWISMCFQSFYPTPATGGKNALVGPEASWNHHNNK